MAAPRFASIPRLSRAYWSRRAISRTPSIAIRSTMSRRSNSRVTRRSSMTAKSTQPPISTMPCKKAITVNSEHYSLTAVRETSRAVAPSEHIMAIKIDRKIVKYNVIKDEDKSPAAATPVDDMSNVIHMHEKIERPDILLGSTYKVKTPLSEHALYVTINDVILYEGTPHELRRPFEIFINSKNMDHFQWIVARTRIISAVFRKGGDVTFLVEELKAVFAPRGGYFKKGVKYMPTLVAEIGDAIENHLRIIGLLKDTGPDEHQRKLIAENRAQYEQKTQPGEDTKNSNFPESAQLCAKCNTKASIVMDGCLTCLNCGDSKCG